MEQYKRKQLCKELTLLLMYQTSFDEKITDEITLKKTWKGYDFTMMNELEEEGFIDQGKHRNRSIYFSDEGSKKAEELLEKYKVIFENED